MNNKISLNNILNHFYDIHFDVLNKIHFNAIAIAALACISHANKIISLDPKCSDTTSLSNIEPIDSSRLSFVSNDPRISFFGLTSLYKSNVSIGYARTKPDFCVKYDLIANDSGISSETLCFKYSRQVNDLRAVHRLGFGSSGRKKEFDLSTISFATELSDSSFGIKLQYGVLRRTSKETVEIVLQFGPKGVETLSSIPDAYKENIQIFDCKRSRSKCINSYAF